MGIVDRVLLVTPGGESTKGARVKKFTAAEGSLPDVTTAFAAVDTPRTEA
jgi:hypothetical protein